LKRVGGADEGVGKGERGPLDKGETFVNTRRSNQQWQTDDWSKRITRARSAEVLGQAGQYISKKHAKGLTKNQPGQLNNVEVAWEGNR